MLNCFVRVERSLDHLDNPGLVAYAHARALLCSLVKLVKLAVAPLRLDIPRGEDRDHDLCIPELVDYLVIVDIAAGKLLVAPNRGRLPKQLAQLDLKHTVKLRDPALLIFIEGLVVQMRVTDENIVHGNKCLIDKWLEEKTME